MWKHLLPGVVFCLATLGATIPTSASLNGAEITVTNKLIGAGAWITIYKDQFGDQIEQAFCVRPGQTQFRHYTSNWVYKAIAEIKDHSNCHGKNMGRLAQDFHHDPRKDLNWLNKTITMSNGHFTW